MTSIIRFHAISGAMSEIPPCFLLQIDEFRFLLDCGWDEKFNMDLIKELKKVATKVDAILLSHPDNYHLGSLPYLVAKCGFSCPVYATKPVFKMGQMFMYDWFLSRNNTEDFKLFNLDDVDEAFGKIHQMDYNSTYNFKGKGLGISITPFPAGHMLGGTMWKISKLGEDDIYYAIDHNNKKERHLNGCEWDKILHPGIFITNAFNTLYTQEKRRHRDEMLIAVLGRTLRSGGNALVAVDSAGRVLELTLLLDQMWRMKEAGLAPFSVVLLNNVAFSLIEMAKLQVDWMSEKLRQSCEGGKPNPFILRNVILCHSLIELSQIPSPKVVLTSCPDLECGFSRDLFMQWCHDPRSCIILTNRTSPGTLARNLIDDPALCKFIELDVRQKMPLQGRELEDYHIKKRQAGMGEIGFGAKCKRDKRSHNGSTSDDEMPTKPVTFKQPFAVTCQICFIDFEGRSDIESMLKMLSDVQPKKLLLVRGSIQSIAALEALTHKLIPVSKVFVPQIGFTLDLTSDRQIYEVKLKDTLMNSLAFKKLRDFELAWCDGDICAPEEQNGSTEDTICPVPVLKPIPAEQASPRDTIFVNRLRLGEFKKLLSKNGIESELVDEKLTCTNAQGVVTIEKFADGRLSINVEGLSDEYYLIRKLLYEQFAIL